MLSVGVLPYEAHGLYWTAHQATMPARPVLQLRRRRKPLHRQPEGDTQRAFPAGSGMTALSYSDRNPPRALLLDTHSTFDLLHGPTAPVDNRLS